MKTKEGLRKKLFKTAGLTADEIASNLSLNFQRSRYKFGPGVSGSITSIPGWTFSRPGYNAIRNSTPTVGAVAGTPGTPPTNWSIIPSGGLSASVITVGTDAITGLPYVDVRFFGTASGGALAQAVRFDTPSGIASTSSFTWTAQARVALVAGSLSNITNVQLVGGVSTNGVTIASTFGITNITPTSTLSAWSASGVTGASTTNVLPYLQLTTAAAGPVDITLRIAAPQLEPGSTVGGYQPTTGTALQNGTNTTYAEGLVDDVVTNLLNRSQEFDHVTWIKTRGSITPNATIAPDGTMTADLFVEDNTPSADHGVMYGATYNYGAGTYTASIYLKPFGNNFAYLWIDSGGGVGHTIEINLTTGATRSTRTDSSSWSAPAFTSTADVNGWWRLSIVSTTSQANVQLRVYTSPTAWSSGNFGTPQYTGGSVNGMYLWGGQIEQRPTPGTYIPTTSGPATGLNSETVINKITIFNANPINLSGWSIDANITASIVNDDVALAAAGLSNIATSGQVYKFVSTAVSRAYARPPGVTGNTSVHVASAWIRGGTGAILSSGLAGAVEVGASVSYVRRLTNPFTPLSSSSVVAFGIDPGQTIYVILPQLIERLAPITQDIVTQGAQALITISKIRGLIPFAPNTPRITDKGMLVEEARTNSIRNSVAAGAVAGTPGTLPTNWSVDVAAGLSSQVVGTGSEGGFNYVDIRVFGTALGNSNSLFWYESSNSIAAVNGQVWAPSYFVSLVGGSISNVADVRSRIELRNSANGFLSSNAVGTAVVPAAQRQYFSGQFTISNASAAFIRPGLSMFHAAGAVDATLRVYAPQLELGANSTSPIPTTTAAATRAADNPYIVDQGGAYRTNKVAIYSANPTVTSGTAKAGAGAASAVVSIADDTTALAAAGLIEAATSGKVFKVDNSAAGGDVYITLTGPTGNTTTNTASAWARVTGGLAEVRVESFGEAYNVSLSTYARISKSGTLDNGTRRFEFKVQSGAIGYFILPQLEDGSTATAPIITTGTPVTVRDPFTGIGRALGQFRTNLIRNSAMAGATSSTLPTNWYTTNGGIGLTWNVVGTGAYSDGVPYIDVRLSGTSTGAGWPSVEPQPRSSVPAVNGQSWVFSETIQIVAGSLPGGSSARIVVEELDAVGGYIANRDIMAEVTTSPQRFIANRTFNGGVSVALAHGYFCVFIPSAGQVYDVTFRLSAPQLEMGLASSAWIPTTTAAASAGNPFTMVAQADLPAADGVARGPVQIDDGTPSNRVLLQRDTSNQVSAFLAPGSSLVTLKSSQTGARILRVACRLRPDVFTGSADGLAVVSQAFSPATLSVLRLGSTSTGSGVLNGYIQRVIIYGDSSDSQLTNYTL